MTESTDEAHERYLRACHAMQTGVAYEMSNGSRDTEPKHLRVGINSAHVAVSALVALLIDRGIFTLDEYVTANADAMETEVAAYERRSKPDNNATVRFQ